MLSRQEVLRIFEVNEQSQAPGLADDGVFSELAGERGGAVESGGYGAIAVQVIQLGFRQHLACARCSVTGETLAAMKLERLRLIMKGYRYD